MLRNAIYLELEFSQILFSAVHISLLVRPIKKKVILPNKPQRHAFTYINLTTFQTSSPKIYFLKFFVVIIIIYNTEKTSICLQHVTLPH